MIIVIMVFIIVFFILVGLLSSYLQKRALAPKC